MFDTIGFANLLKVSGSLHTCLGYVVDDTFTRGCSLATFSSCSIHCSTSSVHGDVTPPSPFTKLHIDHQVRVLSDKIFGDAKTGVGTSVVLGDYQTFGVFNK